MEALIKHTRSRFSRREEPGEGRLPPEKTASFKGGRRLEKWLRRQLSGHQMTLSESGENVEFAAAVAAAAFAISTLESDDVDRRKMKEPQSMPSIAEIGESSKSPEYADAEEEPPEKTIHPVPSIKKTPSMPKKRLTFADEVPSEDPEKAFIGRTPSMKKTQSFGEESSEEDAGRVRLPTMSPTVPKGPTYGEEGLQDAKRMKPADSGPPPPIPPPAVPPLHIQQQPPPPIPPPAVPPLHVRQPPKGQIYGGSQETEADVWEKEEMAKIKERYGKLQATITEWEEKKKVKARQKLETTESELEKRRLKALQKHQTEMEQIQQIADGARAQAKEKQRTEASSDKANRYEEVLATIHEWEEKKKKKATRKLRMTEVELENKRTKARQRYQIEMEQIKEIADGARAQGKEKLRNEELKVKEKANRFRETGEPPLPPLCQCL